MSFDGFSVCFGRGGGGSRPLTVGQFVSGGVCPLKVGQFVFQGGRVL